MKPVSRFALLLSFAFLFTCGSALTGYAEDSSSDLKAKKFIDRLPIMDPDFFKGVDTLVVVDNFGEGAATLLNIDHQDTDPVMIDEVQQIFAKAKQQQLPVDWVSIKPIIQDHQMVETKELEQPNVMMLVFTISAHRETLAGKSVVVADVRADLGRRNTHESGGDQTTYPFVVPDAKQELQERIRDGVFYLTSTLPHYFVCANKHGRKTPQCPDCSIAACNFYETWEERK